MIRASVGTNPITVSQPHVITKKVVNFDSNGLSSTGVDNNAKTRRLQPRRNTKNDRVPFTSKSSCSKNKEVEVEEHLRNLLLSKNKKHMSSECNNVKLSTHNVKFKVVCAMCKQCLISVNHDVCLLNYVNDMNSRGKKQKENVSINENQKKQTPKVKKTKNVESNKRLAPPKPSYPNLFMVRRLELLQAYDRQSKGSHQYRLEVLGTVFFGNDHVAAILEAARTMLIFSRPPLFLWAEAIAIACFTQNRSIIHRRFNKTPYELINSRKPDISFLHVFGALCYPKNDREDIRKLGTKGDIGFFIGYSADSCAYRVYNRRTKKIMEAMNVTFDELSVTAFEQSSSKLGLQSMTSGQISSGQISSGLDLTYAPSTITTQQPTKCELYLLFKAMYDDYIGGQPSSAPRTILAA
nr:retrovirus-related Pol polyprotein from transposon TNT 1-94 [Tanacetum cinerariifolium]